jgi:ribosomal protein L32
MAFLPWALMSDELQQELTTELQECANCGMDDLPHVPGWKLCAYCSELRQLRRRGWDLVEQYADPELITLDPKVIRR